MLYTKKENQKNKNREEGEEEAKIIN